MLPGMLVAVAVAVVSAGTADTATLLLVLMTHPSWVAVLFINRASASGGGGRTLQKQHQQQQQQCMVRPPPTCTRASSTLEQLQANPHRVWGVGPTPLPISAANCDLVNTCRTGGICCAAAAAVVAGICCGCSAAVLHLHSCSVLLVLSLFFAALR
jgi:hypothetical protein